MGKYEIGMSSERLVLRSIPVTSSVTQRELLIMIHGMGCGFTWACV